MPVDASIPLQVQQPNFGNPLQMAQQAMSIKDLMQRSQLQNLQIQQQQQNMANQMLEAKLAAVPGNRDSSGNWTDQGFTQMAAAAPLLVQSERQKQAEREQKLALMASENATTAIKQLEFRDNTLKEARREVLASVAGQPDPETAFDQAWKAKSKELASGGAFGKAPIPQYNFASASKLEALNTGAVDKVEQVERAAANLSRLQATRDKLAKDSNGLDPRIASMDAQIKAGKAMIGHETGEGQEQDKIIKDLNQEAAWKAEYDKMPNKGSAEAIALKSKISALQKNIEKQDAPARTTVNVGVPELGGKAGEKLTGEAYLKTLKPSDAATVKALAEGRILISDTGRAGKDREALLRATQLYDPEFDSAEAKARFSAVKAFSTGKQGDQTRSLNVAVSHMGVLSEAADALKNGDIKMFNTIKNRIAEETGHAAPTDFRAVRDITADEVVKAVVALGGGDADRKGARDAVSAAESPEQLHGVVKRYDQLLGGQLKGLEKQYSNSTNRKDFRSRFLFPETVDALGGTEEPATAAKPAAGKSKDFSNLWN